MTQTVTIPKEQAGENAQQNVCRRCGKILNAEAGFHRDNSVWSKDWAYCKGCESVRQWDKARAGGVEFRGFLFRFWFAGGRRKRALGKYRHSNKAVFVYLGSFSQSLWDSRQDVIDRTLAHVISHEHIHRVLDEQVDHETSVKLDKIAGIIPDIPDGTGISPPKNHDKKSKGGNKNGKKDKQKEKL